MKLLIAAAVVAWLPGAAGAQVLPGLGADRAVGSAGVETIALFGSNGLPANPAGIGAGSRWAFGLGTATNSVTSLAERSATASLRVRRVGLGMRVTTRSITNLFEDPALRDDPDLRVGREEYVIGASFLARDWLRIGLAGVMVQSQVLGSSGNGVGLRAGLAAQGRWIVAGATLGDTDVNMTWRASDGTRERWHGTRRLAVGVATPPFRLGGFQPAAAVEWNSDAGIFRGTWLRGTVSLGALDGALRLVGGAADSRTQPTADYQEAGVIATVGWLQFQFGMRFGADPVPGYSLTLGLALRGS